MVQEKGLLVGVLVNSDYTPSLLAGTYISKVLDEQGVKTTMLSLDEIIRNEVNCDTVFNVYYGEIGDGGIVSGILGQSGINFIGNSQYTCSLMLNKVISKMLFSQHGYLTAPFWYQPNRRKTDQTLMQEIEGLLQYPMLAKPVNGAASENICVIGNRDQLREFIVENRAMVDCGYYFIEQFIKGIELSAGYVNAIGDVLPVVEIRLLGETYQSNKVKFSSGFKKNIIPAKIDPDIYESAQLIAQDLNLLFKCTAFSRTDMIYSEQNQELCLLEINTNPGLLESSLLLLMARVAGISEGEFFLRLINHSMEKSPR